MQLFQKAILIVLVLMSLAAGAVKILQMQQEVEFFQAAGLGIVWLVSLGVVQIAGGVLAVFARHRKPGAAIMAFGFLVSSIVIFMTGNVVFGVFSLLPVLLAGVLMIGRP